MRLWAWIPRGVGPDSFYVMAATEDDARDAVKRLFAEEVRSMGSEPVWPWDDCNYELKAVGPNVVLTNGNW